MSVDSGASVHTAHPRKSLGIYMGAHPGRNGHPGRAHCCPSGPCTAHVQGGPWGTWCSCWTTTARPVGAAQACWPLGVQAFHSPMKLHRSQKAATCASPAALEQQASWGRPPFGTQMQLCVGMSRELSVEITFLLSNRAEKPVSRPPGPCCTLECAVPSRPGGQQPK